MEVSYRTAARMRLRRARRLARDAVLGTTPSLRTVREDVGLRYLAGDGIEIGALDFPLRVPRGVTVRYVDRKPASELRVEYPWLADHDFVDADIIDDGERLSRFDASSLDFVVASHMIEHTEDPISTLAAHVRVLRPGGISLLVVPDRRHTFDRDRASTPLDHLIRDHRDGPTWSRRDHYREWARLVEKLEESSVERRAAELEAARDAIHFHVWELEGFLALISYCERELQLPARLLHAQMNQGEFVIVLRKASESV